MAELNDHHHHHYEGDLINNYMAECSSTFYNLYSFLTFVCASPQFFQSPPSSLFFSLPPLPSIFHSLLFHIITSPFTLLTPSPTASISPSIFLPPPKHTLFFSLLFPFPTSSSSLFSSSLPPSPFLCLLEAGLYLGSGRFLSRPISHFKMFNSDFGT